MLTGIMVLGPVTVPSEHTTWLLGGSTQLGAPADSSTIWSSQSALNWPALILAGHSRQARALHTAAGCLRGQPALWRKRRLTGAPTAGSEGVRNSATACAFSMRSSSQPGIGGPRRQASYGLNGCTGVAYFGRSMSKRFAMTAAAPGSASSLPAPQLPALECVAEVTAVLALLVTASACARVSGASACRDRRCRARRCTRCGARAGQSWSRQRFLPCQRPGYRVKVRV